MLSKRSAIDIFRVKLQENTADTEFTNQFLCNLLQEHAKWLIKREVSAGRIYVNNSLFQPWITDIIETSTIPSCVNIKNNCKIYRTKNRLPETWADNNGPIIRYATSLDGSREFNIIDPLTWASKANDPYQKKYLVNYIFFSDGYFWFPQVNPHKAIIHGFYVDDLVTIQDTCEGCDNNDCIKFLDTDFRIPDWIEAEMYSKALEQIVGITKKIPEDEQVDKNSTRKN